MTPNSTPLLNYQKLVLKPAYEIRFFEKLKYQSSTVRKIQSWADAWKLTEN